MAQSEQQSKKPAPSDAARALFASSGLTYADVTLPAFKRLCELIEVELSNFDSGYEEGSFTTERGTAYNYHVADQTLISAEIRCRSSNFRNREAVSFNRDGFIGFAGWAGSDNVAPIIAGFTKWVMELTRKPSDTKLAVGDTIQLVLSLRANRQYVLSTETEVALAEELLMVNRNWKKLLVQEK